MRILICDLEANGFLDVLDKLHIFVAYDPAADQTFEFTCLKKLQKFLNKFKDYYLVGHNFICFDVPALEKLGITVPNKIIDTLPLSWYLHLHRPKHGLASWGELVGIEKPEVEEWENQPFEVYQHRCNEDVKINTAIWNYFWPRMLTIYGTEDKALKFCNYLNWKMHQQRIQENNLIRLDVPAAESLLDTLQGLKEEKEAELARAMPKVPVMKAKKRPKVMFKMNGEPSANNIKWSEFLKEQGISLEEADKILEEEGEIKFVSGYKDPNPASHQQVKDWLTNMGWRPQTFKKVKKDKEPEVLEAEKKEEKERVKVANEAIKIKHKKELKRGRPRLMKEKWIKPYTIKQIPQILTEDKEVCPSITKLAEEHPEVMALDRLGVINHRIGLVKGLINSAEKRNGYVQARCHAFTNTLRLKHAELVNIPSGRKEFGKEIRSLLVAEKGKCFLGSDLSSLEDRLKHHFQWPLDQEYVKSQMSDGFDPHLLIAVFAGLMKEEQADWYKSSKKIFDELSDKDKKNFKGLDKIRSQGKGTNYSCQYGAGPATVAESAGVDLATGEKLHKGYWEVNWTIKQIASETIVKEDESSQKWQLNPINGFWYHLKTEKDRFSTLIQGSGAYIFDMWVYFANEICKDKFSRELPLSAQFHDELLLQINVLEKSKNIMEGVVKESISMLNSYLKLNRDMDIDVAFGHTYYEVH